MASILFYGCELWALSRSQLPRSVAASAALAQDYTVGLDELLRIGQNGTLSKSVAIGSYHFWAISFASPSGARSPSPGATRRTSTADSGLSAN